MHWIACIVLFLVLARLAAQLWLASLNRRHVEAHADKIPDAFKETIDQPTYAKSVAYTLAKNQFGQRELIFDAVLLLVVLFSGVLPWWSNLWTTHWGYSLSSKGMFLLATAVLLSLPNLPWEWHAQFKLEERFGFNTSTPRLWVTDRLKGLALAVVLGFPLLLLILKFMDWGGSWWWLWAWGSFMAFQLLLIVLAPSLIMPLFNKFTPLPEGSLRTRLLALGERTGFTARTIQVMDGSRRSRHSNAFFTGFGRFRKIVLFDTLVTQLGEAELEAVLAHEIGHSKLRHIPRMLAGSAAGLLAGFYALSWLARQASFYHAFGFPVPQTSLALLLFALLSGTITFWFTPVANLISRKFEYEADRYAVQTMAETVSLTGALRKLNEKNLSNLTPHPVFSGFYYSHPTLLEREMAIRTVLNPA